MTSLLMIKRRYMLPAIILLSLCWTGLGFVQAPASFLGARHYTHDLSLHVQLPTSSMMDPSFLLETASLTTASSSDAVMSSGSLSAITAVELGGIPALLMLVFTIAGLRIKTSPVLVGALQHFAAGILLSTIAIELLPEMMNATGLQENLASGVGFFAGVAVLIGLGVVLPQEETESIVQTETKKAQHQHSPLCQSLRNRQQSFKAEAFCAACAMEQALDAELLPTSLDESIDETMTVTSKSDTVTMEEIMTIQSPTAAFPTALVTAIAIDSALDGLLIGIAIAAGPSTGPMLSASLAVEMSFLGLTLAAALYGRSLSSSLPAAVLGPTVLLLGSFAGGALATTFADSPVLLAGLLGFGTSSLLFMVAEELLLEAHEEGAHVWWSDLQLYTGFFASILADKFVLAT
jgi:ZIP family zinc transporter